MNPLYLTVTGALAAAIALTFAIPALIRRARIDALATLPVAPVHRLRLPAGDVVLYLAGPLGTIGLGALSFELVDGSGDTMPSTPIVVRSRRSSGRWGVLLAVRRFQVPVGGEYEFHVAKIAADRDLSRCRLVLARPQDAGFALGIIAVVLAAVTLVVCSVLSLILWLSPGAMEQASPALPAAIFSKAR